MEINDYVRTKSGRITKIKEFIKESSNGLFFNFYSDGLYGIEKQDITKHSKDIIKLLEKGDILVDYNDDLYVVDYIDGYYVFTTAKINKTTIKTLVDYQIKKVLTHEQFEANAYKIEKER